MLARHLLIVLDDSVHYFYIRAVDIFSLFKIMFSEQDFNESFHGFKNLLKAIYCIYVIYN